MMKYLNLLVLLIFCCSLKGQTLPDPSSIFSIEPEWSYVSEDTNWYRILEFNPHIDQYFGRAFHNGILNGNDYYLLEFSSGQTTNPPLTEGYFLHKIDINSGESKWVHYDNFFSGNDFVVSCFGGNMNLNDDGNIIVNGFKSLDSLSMLTDENQGFAYVNVMRHLIDTDNGLLINERVDLDTSRTSDKLHPGGFLLRRVANNRQIKHIFNNVFEDGLVRNYLRFFDVNEEGIVSDDPVFSYKHTTIVDFDFAPLSYANLYYQINPNMGVALFGSIDQTQGNNPAAMKLVFFDTSNSPDIVVSEERDILNVIPQPQENSTGIVTIRGSDNHFFVGQKVKIPFEDRFIWVQWYDASGEPIQTIERLQVDGLNMDLIEAYTFVDGKLYMICRKFGTGLEGLDEYFILMSEKESELKKLGSFTKNEEFEDYRIGFSGMKMLEDRDILLHMRITYPGPWEFLKPNISFLCRFDGTDLGLVTSTAEVEVERNGPIFPNPARDYLNISDGLENIENVTVFDAFGQSKRIELKGQDQLIISDLASGNYYLQYFKKGKMHVYPFIKI